MLIKQISIFNMKAQSSEVKHSLEQKLLFNLQKLDEFKKIIETSIRCYLHQNSKPIIIIKQIEFPKNFESLCIACQKCTNLYQKKNYFIFEGIFQMFHICQSFKKQSVQEECVNAEIKRKIKEYLCQKKMRKIKWATYFQCLNQKTKQFFFKDIKNTEVIQHSHLNQTTSKNYLNQCKFWIKNPDLFKQTFLMECSKALIQKMLWIKHNIFQYSRYLRNLLIKCFIATEQMNELHVLSFFSNKHKVRNQKQIKIIKQVVKHHKEKIKNQKQDILKKAYLCLKMQSDFDKISEDLSKFIKLYKNVQSLNSYNKFNMLNNFYFCSNIIENIISLRQPNLIKHFKISYEPLQYQSQFQNLNNGQFIFNNQFRNDTFYNREIQLHRNLETIIGQEYTYSKNKQKTILQNKFIDQQNKNSEKICQLCSPMKPNQKILLKLRLNFQLQGNLKIGVKWSSSIQNYLLDIHDQSNFINIKIIPDTRNQNKKPFKSNQIANLNYQIQQQTPQYSKKSQSHQYSKEKQTPQYIKESLFEEPLTNIENQNTFLKSQYQFNRAYFSQDQFEITYKVIQDDQISLNFNAKSKQLTYFNQTQRKHICIRQIKVGELSQFYKYGKLSQSEELIQLQQTITTYFPIYVSIELSTSIPEIQILENAIFYQ